MKQHPNKIIVTAILTTAASLLFVAIAQAKPTPSFTPIYGNNATYMQALHVRSQALNDRYSPTNALMLRSEALNAKYGLGDYATRNVGYLRARHVPVQNIAQYGPAGKITPTTSQAASASGGFDWAEGLVGSLALFATILVIGSAIVIAQRRQEGRPLGV